MNFNSNKILKMKTILPTGKINDPISPNNAQYKPTQWSQNCNHIISKLISSVHIDNLRRNSSPMNKDRPDSKIGLNYVNIKYVDLRKNKNRIPEPDKNVFVS